MFVRFLAKQEKYINIGIGKKQTAAVPANSDKRCLVGIVDLRADNFIPQPENERVDNFGPSLYCSAATTCLAEIGANLIECSSVAVPKLSY
jgi:hypothetical protein